MIELTHLALALLTLGILIVGGVFGLLVGCCCAVSGNISRHEEADGLGDPWWPS